MTRTAAAPATWDITLAKVLRHAQTSFALDVRFSTRAPRVVLLGPSGAGKTQTLKMIAGITRPDTGRVAVGGQVLYDATGGVNLSPQQRRLACVFQDYALFPHLTVRQNIAFAQNGGWLNPPREAAWPNRPSSLSPRPRAAAKRAEHADPVERWIAAFHLEAVSALYPHQLSGGQRQRTALARALVREPIALLLDEPFAALDKPLRQHLRGELRDLQATLALPMLLITHDDEDVATLADEVVALDAGRVVSTEAEASSHVAHPQTLERR